MYQASFPPSLSLPLPLPRKKKKKKTPNRSLRVSLLVRLYHTALVTTLPLHPQAMWKAPAMILC